MRKYSIISLLVFMAVFALMTVSYVKPWSYISIGCITRGLSVKYTDFETDDLSQVKLKYFIQLCNASLAFAILAWIGSIVMIIVSIIDIMEKKLPQICRFLGWIVFLFCLISFSIYLGTPEAEIKDCRNTFLGSDDCDILAIYQQRLIGNYIGYRYQREVEYKFGLSAGWICIVIAWAVSLFGSIYNLFFFNHQSV
ncbi:hypothetical protein ACTFIY_007050 [Dictyostelium cf. discoideum]